MKTLLRTHDNFCRNSRRVIQTSGIYTSVVDLVDEEEPEQATLDHHDDLVASMTLRIQKLIAKLKPPPDRKVESQTPHTQTEAGSGLPISSQ